jgi:sugar phosphate isomerase/epimerase
MPQAQPHRFDDIGWVLWSGHIGLASPLSARIEAASAAGYTRFSVNPIDMKRATRDGRTAAELGRYFRDSGLEIVMDAVINWYDAKGAVWPFRAKGRDELSEIAPDEVMRMSEALGVVSMTALSHPAGEVPMDALVEPFGTLCDQAAGFGAQVHLEFMPMLAVGDLAAAWSIISGADRPNGGILLDTWHFYRGGSDFATLEQVPGDRIFTIQVSDAAAQVNGSLIEETFNRLMPGDGSLDLLHLLAALDQRGALRWIGPEVISPATAAMDPVAAADLARRRIEHLIDQARSPDHGG